MKQSSKDRCRRLFKMLLCAVGIWLAFLSPEQFEQVESLCGLSDFQDQSRAWPFALHVLDVGKADALLVTAGDRTLLIDSGTTDCGDAVSAYLHRLGVQKLDAVYVTHPDEDHYGGFFQVLQEFPCGRFCVSDVPEELKPPDYLRLEELAAAQNIPVEVLSAGDTQNYPAFFIDVLSPGKPYETTNDNSLVLRLTCGQRRFLLMGDAEKTVEEDLLAAGEALSADVLKVGHHGSKTSSTEAFLQAVSPQYAAISAGEDRSHLPKKDVLDRLAQTGAEILRTDTRGTVLFCTDGDHIQVYTEYSPGE